MCLPQPLILYVWWMVVRFCTRSSGSYSCLELLKYGDFEQLAAFDLRDLHCRGSMTLTLHNENSV